MRLAHLTPLYERPGPWASICVATPAADEATPGQQERAAREVCRELGLKGADAATGRAVHAALTEWPVSVGAVGRAVYATHGQVVLDPPLTVSPPVDEVHWSVLPRVTPLLDLSVREPVCLVAYIDREGAAFELRGPLGSHASGEAEGKDWPLYRTATAGWSERHFRMRVENAWDDGGGEVAAALALCQEEARADLIVLVGGDGERRAVMQRLPKPLRSLSVGVEPGRPVRGSGMRLPDADVERARQEHARRTEEAELDHFRAPGTARAQGVLALVEAAREQRIAELLVRPDGPDVRREVWVGPEPDQIAMRRGATRYLGEHEPRPARADDALLRSAAVDGADVLRVHPADGTDGRYAVGPGVPAGGLGALLRRR
ncbi:Vms1/Ankzf1 family peptidyl-tRNA hydrolase [Streptomyces sp. NPDC057445]|uniref:baeRF2 domain-containing protein n=1 Tax=Streptomyces sp. NPDC057445 TaxID=3346136 RepID=UPI0036C2F49D